jgi:hypothetical protein
MKITIVTSLRAIGDMYINATHLFLYILESLKLNLEDNNCKFTLIFGYDYRNFK